MVGRLERREQTRAALVAEGRRLFAAKGYGAVGLAEIVAAAKVTKGALYHHFDSKADLFRAVLQQVQDEVGAQVAEVADAQEDPWAQFTAGCRCFLSVTTHPDVQRIMLIDGPAVLGWSEWRAMDEAASARHLAEAITGLMDDGVIARRPVRPLTHLLSGAMNEAALFLAGSSDPQDLPDTVAALTRILESLRRDGG
ncbi:TetR/AcrR family transcriptional regulator [Spongiactinospora sp. TRM90649]|uniref:TetR/AcrR family transcriptional regulator n=1 Tax=Spongiactinospora sp. TRM90649 TaxID=3031114 RepID=UPI0023F6DF18|nr:TetR/AcrR family transcriptional regulator [Spongiactinospora sp. TRM90649]MDF5759332.1 TetR/AcrR family transcriptional regulator [Spongiactinospora sp. TRM90649]